MNGLHALCGFRKRRRRVGIHADRSFHRRVHVRHDDVRAGLGQGGGLGFVEGVRAGEHVEFVGQTDHLDFEVETHARLLQNLPEITVDHAHGGEILNAVETRFLELFQKDGHQPEGIGAAYARQHGGVLDDRQDLAGHVHDDGVRVAVGHEACRAAPARHAVAPGIVNDDEIDAAPLGELGGNTGSGAGAYDRFACRHLIAKALQALLVWNEWHGSMCFTSSGRSSVRRPRRRRPCR